MAANKESHKLILEYRKENVNTYMRIKTKLFIGIVDK